MVAILKLKTSLSTNVTADLKHFFEAAPDEGNKKGEMALGSIVLYVGECMTII